MINLMQGDCLELMQEIPDKSINMILCDLPYGITKNKWDSVIPLDQLWDAYNRIIKDRGAIVLFSSMPFTCELGASNIKNLRYEWIWDKRNPVNFLNAKRQPLRQHENILVFYKKSPTYNPQFSEGKPYNCKVGAASDSWGSFNPDYVIHNDGRRYPIDIQSFAKERGLHPTQKPVPLLEYLIKTYTNKGDTVLDNCMGSGSTGVACVNTGRDFIGIEINEEYFEIARRRITDDN